MIITVTLNPAVDKTVTVPKLCPGELNRILTSREDAGGKGINVSKTINSLGGKSIATGFLGGSAGQTIERSLKALNIESSFTCVENATRTNLKVVDQEGCVTEINEPGPEISVRESEKFYQNLMQMLKPGDLVILSGSIPGGISTDYYGRLIRDIHAHAGEVFLDADRDVFAEAVKERPDIVKPNMDELERYCEKEGICFPSEDHTDDASKCAGEQELIRQAVFAGEQELIRRAAFMGDMLKQKGIGEVIVSLGSDGAVFLTEEKNYYAPGIRVAVHSTVGAGDAMVGAYAYAKSMHMSVEERIRLSMAVAAGAVTTQGTNPAGIELVHELMHQIKIFSL